MLPVSNLSGLVLWPNKWSLLENVPCALERVFCCFFWRKCSMYMFYVQSGLLRHAETLFSWFFHMDDLSISVKWGVKSPSSIVLPAVSLFNICFIYLSVAVLGA